MLKLGIDCATFCSSHYYIEHATLAKARGIDANKYHHGLGAFQMAVSPPDEDIVSLAATASSKLIEKIDDIDSISTVLFATESGVDQSKAAGIFVHRLLKLPKQCRVVELKQACYSATSAIQLGLGYLHQNPDEKILLIAADIARYGLNTPGEASQGGGAVAMILSANPRLLAVEPKSGFVCEDAMDFWRPNYRDAALVEGKFSCDLYLRMLRDSWQHYQHKTQRDYTDHQHFCFHTPLPRLAEKANQKLAMINHVAINNKNSLQASLQYSRAVGNCYTASLYLSLISLLDHLPRDFTDQRIGFYSYGSGAVAEFFSGVVQPGYQNVLFTQHHQQLLAKREALDIDEYQHFYQFELPTDGSSFSTPNTHHDSQYRLSGIHHHKRQYERVIASERQATQTGDNVVPLHAS